MNYLNYSFQESKFENRNPFNWLNIFNLWPLQTFNWLWSPKNLTVRILVLFFCSANDFFRFGSKCCRIFRLLMMKKHLEQKQVEEFAMIPGKEAKGYMYNVSLNRNNNSLWILIHFFSNPGVTKHQFIYFLFKYFQLLAENMLVMQEIPRTPNHAPSRTFYLFAVDLHRVSRMLLMRSYKVHCVKEINMLPFEIVYIEMLVIILSCFLLFFRP